MEARDASEDLAARASAPGSGSVLPVQGLHEALTSTLTTGPGRDTDVGPTPHRVARRGWPATASRSSAIKRNPCRIKGAGPYRTPDQLAPPQPVDDLVGHLAAYAESGTAGLLFTGSRGGELRRGNFHRETAWTRTVVEVGLPAGFHFHDLRHTGNQLAAMSGASTRELMRRTGHGSMRAAAP